MSPKRAFAPDTAREWLNDLLREDGRPPTARLIAARGRRVQGFWRLHWDADRRAHNWTRAALLKDIPAKTTCHGKEGYLDIHRQL